MVIYPAIDLKGGECVRLLQGKADKSTVYSGDPAGTAKRWAALGAQYLHVVDLDGAFSGKGANLDAVRSIVKAVDIPVQLGGGIRCMADVEERFDAGVARVILGTAAISDREFFAQAAAKYGDRIVAGIDAKDGFVAVRGWVERTDATPVELALELKRLGVTTCVYTDISRDGMMKGVNVQATAHLSEVTGLDVIASGGVSCLDDIRALAALSIHGAITGKALYDGALDLAQAIAVGRDAQIGRRANG